MHHSLGVLVSSGLKQGQNFGEAGERGQFWWVAPSLSAGQEMEFLTFPCFKEAQLSELLSFVFLVPNHKFQRKWQVNNVRILSWGMTTVV